MLRKFWNEEEAMGTVEIVLIIVVLIALVTIFSGGIRGLIETVMAKITTGAEGININ